MKQINRIFLITVVAYFYFTALGKCDELTRSKETKIPLGSKLGISGENKNQSKIHSQKAKAKVIFYDKTFDQFPIKYLNNNIPKGYDTYTYFIVPDTDWIKDAKLEDLSNLRMAFDHFGKSIGNDNLALWFADEKGNSTSLEIGKSLCDLLDLGYSDGPYIIVSEFPDVESSIVFPAIELSLKNLDPPKITKVLHILEQDLRISQLPIHSAKFEAIYQRFEEPVKRIAKTYGLQIAVFLITKQIK